MIQKALDGTLNATYIVQAVAEGAVELTQFSSFVPREVARSAQLATQRLQAANGQQLIFCGPIRDNTGALRVPAGACMTKSDLSQVSF